MTINKKLSVRGCWAMVNAIQNGKTPQEIRERCDIAEKWLLANENLDVDTFDDMMRTIAYLYNESSHVA